MYDYKPTESELSKIKGLLQVGNANGKTDSELSGLTGIGKRNVRHIITELIIRDVPVCNNHDGKGYFLPETADDIRKNEQYIHSYVLRLLRREYRLKKARENFGVERMA